MACVWEYIRFVAERDLEVFDRFQGNLWYSLTLLLKHTFNVFLGDLVFFYGLGNNLLVLNSMEAINDLLEKRGQIYSDRPIFTVVGELMGLNQVI